MTAGEGASGVPSPTPAVQETDTELTIRRVGHQIRTLRSARGLTLQDLAAHTGVSVSMLSMVERGVAGASIGTLVAVSSALGVHMSDLFDVGPERVFPVRTRAEQVEVQTAQGVVRRVAHHDPFRGLEMVVNEYAPGTASAAGAVHHTGTEFGVVVTGRLTVEVDGTRHDGLFLAAHDTSGSSSPRLRGAGGPHTRVPRA